MMPIPSRLLILALAAVAAALVACATPDGRTSRAADGQLRTASDQTDADRRAAVRLELAAGYFGRGQYETALDEIKLALLAKPELGAAFGLRGLVYASMGEDRLAENSFARALEINPRDADALHNRGWFYCQRNRFEEAQVQFEQALALPQYRDVERTLLAQGVCQARAGRLDEAERHLQRAYELNPANPTTALNLSEVLYRRGEFERARFYIRRVNANEDLVNAQTLWLALRIEHRLGNRGGVAEFSRRLRDRFPQAPETLQYEQGRIDD